MILFLMLLEMVHSLLFHVGNAGSFQVGGNGDMMSSFKLAVTVAWPPPLTWKYLQIGGNANMLVLLKLATFMFKPQTLLFKLVTMTIWSSSS